MVERFLIDLLEGSRLTRTLFLISLATACSKAPAPESTIQFVYKSSIQSADTTPPELSDDDCFLVHVTGDHSSLRAVAPRSDQASACPAGPQGLGLLNGLLKKGETVSLSVPSGPARRFDIVAIPKALLPLGNRECRGTVSGKAALEKGVFGNPDFFVDSEKVSSKNFKLIATGTADLSPGVNVVTLERVQSSAPYECVANEVVETKIVSTSVISPDGSYGATQTIDIQINFSEGVVVSGSPRLKLETGTVDHSASFLSITADKKGLVFRYPIVAGDATSALEYFSQTSLELNGGTIKTETSGTNVLLTLPPPGSAVSLSGGRFVSIDTVNPNLTITTPSSLFANATTSANLVFTGTCSESGEVVSVIPAVVASPVTCTGAHAWAMTVNVSTQSDGPVNLQFSHHDLA
ncbi:MAG: hypothetical protein ABIR96_13305, partial [Bdellovibrionota bacterium]